MIEEQQAVCKEILQRIMDIPCSKLFIQSNRDVIYDHITTPLCLEDIAKKLDHGVYPSTHSFVQNMRTLFTNAMRIETGFRHLAAKYCYEYFEKLLREGSPSTHPCSLSVLKLEKELAEVSRILKAAPKPQPRIRNPAEVSAEIFKVHHRLDPTLPYTLKDDLKLIASPDLLLKVAVFVIERQPECVLLSSSLTFNFALMTPDTKHALHRYIHQLIMESATGKL